MIKKKKGQQALKNETNERQALSWFLIKSSIKWPWFSIHAYSGPWGWIQALLCLSLITQTQTVLCLFCLLCLPSLLTLCSLYCVGADMRGKQAERSLSLSLSLSVTVFLCPSLTYSCVLTSEVLGGEALPCDSFVTLWQPVECHWENITSTNVALCDTAFEVEKSWHLCTVVCACKGDHCSLRGLVARVLIAAWPVGILLYYTTSIAAYSHVICNVICVQNGVRHEKKSCDSHTIYP